MGCPPAPPATAPATPDGPETVAADAPPAIAEQAPPAAASGPRFSLARVASSVVVRRATNEATRESEPVTSLPECEPTSLALDERHYAVEATCVFPDPDQPDDETLSRETEESETCALTVTDGSAPQVHVHCDAHSDGGAHPDWSSYTHRFWADDLQAVSRCDLELMLRDGELARGFERALSDAGCPVSEFGEYASCDGFALSPATDGRALVFASLYLPRVERSHDCDQLSVAIDVPMTSLPAPHREEIEAHRHDEDGRAP
jgi:hypothetical protein